MSTPTPPTITPTPMQQPATWSKVARAYAEELEGHHARFAHEALRIAEPDTSAEVLDVAAGPGALTFAAAPRVARVLAIDFAEGMVDQVNARSTREGMSNVDAAVMDALALDLPDESFDAAFCLFGFMFLPDRAQAFREMHRVLRPGGRAVVATWAPLERRPWMKIGFDALASVIPDMPPPPKGDMQEPDECIDEMTAGGFENVRAAPFNVSIHVESAEQYLRMMERAAPPFVLLKEKLGEGEWANTSAHLLETMRQKIPEGGAGLAAEAIFTSGQRCA